MTDEIVSWMVLELFGLAMGVDSLQAARCTLIFSK